MAASCSAVTPATFFESGPDEGYGSGWEWPSWRTVVPARHLPALLERRGETADEFVDAVQSPVVFVARPFPSVERIEELRELGVRVVADIDDPYLVRDDMCAMNLGNILE